MHYIIVFFVALSTVVGGYVVQGDVNKVGKPLQESVKRQNTLDNTKKQSTKQNADAENVKTVSQKDDKTAVAVIPIKKEPVLEETKKNTLLPPTIDIARIEQDGDAVIAGRGERGSFVKILADNNEVAVEAIDDKGEWLYVSEAPLNEGKPGAIVIGLIGVSADGLTQVNSPQTVTVIIPEKERKPLVIAQKKNEVTEILQQSETKEAETDKQTKLAETIQPKIEEKKAEPKPNNQRHVLQIQVFDYLEEEKKMFISGTARAASLLRLYINNIFLLDFIAKQDGTFEASKVVDALEIGTHKLRLDEVDENAQVIDRLEVSFEKKKQQDVVVQIVRGDNLWNIARRIYGKGIRYTVIYEANKNNIKNPNLIYPGQVFVAPRKEDLE